MEVVPAWAPAVGFTLLPHAGGFLGSNITKREIPTWYETLQKPSWCPPNWVFAPVWGTLYTSMGYVFHIGLVTLLLTTGTATATTASWYNINKTAAYLMVPYLAWLGLASALNYWIWKDNRNKK
ncbi:TSPO protein, partial [Oxylabes madagascariensis]|nr:TSPO protein [Oxylabes madagascariensis]